jgi:hypothetical protein
MKSDDRAALGRRFASLPSAVMRNTVAAARASAAAKKNTALNMSLFKRGTQHAHMASQDRDKSCMEYKEVGTCSRPCISPSFLHAVQTRMPVEVEVRAWVCVLSGSRDLSTAFCLANPAGRDNVCANCVRTLPPNRPNLQRFIFYYYLSEFRFRALRVLL